MNVDLITNGILWMITFVFSATLHEAAHAFVAAKGGDMTAYHGGQVTLNPIPHMQREPFGMIIVPIISFFFFGWMMGWASAPYDPYWAARHPRRSALMALAGPISNLLVAAVAFVLLVLFAGQADLNNEFHLVLTQFGMTLFFLNLLLFVFNLFPVPPLDGAEAIILFMPENFIEKWRGWMAQIGFFGIFIAWYAFPKVFGPIFAIVAIFIPDQAITALQQSFG